MAPRILMIDDDEHLSEMVGEYLGARGIELVAHPDAGSGLEALRGNGFDALVLDVMLPDLDGFEVCRAIRETSEAPVIMLTARGGEVDKVKGLEMGADDYITKPFSHLELLARIRAVLRRYQLGAIGNDEEPFEKGPLRFDFAAHKVEYNGEPIPLTPLEWNLMYHLIKNYPNVVQHRTLLAKVWGREYIDEMDYLKVHVQRIRTKFKSAGEDADVIANERGVGYRLSMAD